MYLSAERLAIANQAVQETFQSTSIAWQAIPHWDTRDPAQTRVPNGDPTNVGFTDITRDPRDFDATLAEVTAPTPDDLVARVIMYTVELAGSVDGAALPRLWAAGTEKFTPPKPVKPFELTGTTPDELLTGLIDARASVEDAGYRAPSCLITNTAGLQALSKLESGYPVIEALMSAANVNSMYRSNLLDKDNLDKVRLLVIGRRQRIPHGGACEASPGEEPVDLAVSVPPDLDVIGADKDGKVAMTVRVGYAARITDKTGLVAVYEK